MSFNDDVKIVAPKLLASLILALGLTVPAVAQQCPNTGRFVNPSAQRFANPGVRCRPVPNCPVRNVQQAGIRPTRTAGGTPIRYVNVQVPNFAACGPRNGYGYGYGWGAGGYGYGYGYNGFNYSQATSFSAAPALNSSAPRWRTQRKAARKAPRKPLQVDKRSAQNHQLRKALDQFARDNSVGGKLYLKSSSSKWMLAYDGRPQYQGDTVVIPCRGRKDKGHEQQVSLVLSVKDSQVIGASVQPNG